MPLASPTGSVIEVLRREDFMGAGSVSGRVARMEGEDDLRPGEGVGLAAGGLGEGDGLGEADASDVGVVFPRMSAMPSASGGSLSE